MRQLIYLFTLILITSVRVHAQDDEGDDSIPIEYPDFNSGSAEIILETYAVVRYQNSCDVYLRWTNPTFSVLNTVFYRPVGTSMWSELRTLEQSILVSHLPLDSKYEWKVESNALDERKYSGIAVFTTDLVEDNIEVSQELYNRLVLWTREVQNPITLHNYLNGIDNISIYEKVSFYQSYEYGGKAFTRVLSLDDNSDDVRNWVNPGTENNFGDCNCKVVTHGSLTVSPIDRFDEDKGIIFPKKENFKKTISGATTYFDYVSRGASKFVALKQYERDGSSVFEHSNLNKSDNSKTSPQFSKINFFLLCMDDTKVPSKCACCRTLDLRYNYSSKIQASSDTRRCIWSKGSYAKAEDAALVVAYYASDLGKSVVLGADQYMVSATCNKNWNPTFFVNYVDFVYPIVKVLAAKDAKLEDLLKIADQIAESIKKLIATPTHNREGRCDRTIIESRDLLDGRDKIEICPNSPIEVGMFSFHHVMVGGYGCWHPKAAVASDMYLAGVVESKNVPDDPYCCTNKRAVYIAASCGNSKIGPGNLKEGRDVVPLDAPHSTDDRLRDVGFFINQFGIWDNIQYGSSSNLPLLTKEFYARLIGPSCKHSSPTGNPRSKAMDKMVTLTGNAKNYALTFNGFKNTSINLHLFSLAGVEAIGEKRIWIHSDSETLELDDLILPNGIYILYFKSGNYEFHEKLFLN